MATGDSALCTFPGCEEPQNQEGGFLLCDVHSGLLSFVHWYFNHATYNGVRVCDILGSVVSQFAGPPAPIFGPDGAPMPPRPPQGWNN